MMPDMDDQLLLDQRDGLATLTLNRPDKRNALSIELRERLADALDELAADHEVNAVLLTGAGPAFCAGVDVTQFGGDTANRERLVSCSARAFGGLADFPKPLVAHVHGPALAGGFVLALLCDVRIAGPHARFGFPELHRGIPPGYAAARAVLPDGIARELCLTGRIVEPDEALRIGLATSLGDQDAARAVAAAIAAAPAQATRETKRRALAAGAGTWRALLDDELEQLRAALLGG